MFHFSADWVRADPALGSFATGSVSAYIAGRSHWLGRPLSRPHSSSEIASKGVCVPDGVTTDTNELWQTADRLERRKDGLYQMRSRRLPRVAIHVDAALPFGLTDEVAHTTAETYAQKLVDRFGVVVQWAVHNKAMTKNDHVHFLISTRSFRQADFGRKVRQFDGIAQKKKELAEHKALFVASTHGVKQISSEMERMRRDWATLISEASGVVEDHRSFSRQGLPYEPAPYVPRGEIEFQKRREQRTGHRPAWKVARELALQFRELASPLAGLEIAISQTKRSTRKQAASARRARLREMVTGHDVGAAHRDQLRRLLSGKLSAANSSSFGVAALNPLHASPGLGARHKPQVSLDAAKARRARFAGRCQTEAKRLGALDIPQEKLGLRDRLRSAILQTKNIPAWEKSGPEAALARRPDPAKSGRLRRIAFRAQLAALPSHPDAGASRDVVEQREIQACSDALMKNASALARRIELPPPGRALEAELQVKRMSERLAKILAEHIRTALRRMKSEGAFMRLLERQSVRSAEIEREHEACSLALRARGRHARRGLAIRARLRDLQQLRLAVTQLEQKELDDLRQHQIGLHSNFPDLEDIRLQREAVVQPREFKPAADSHVHPAAGPVDLALELARRLHCDRKLTKDVIEAIAEAAAIDERRLISGLAKDRIYDPPPRPLASLLSALQMSSGAGRLRLLQIANDRRSGRTEKDGLARVTSRPKPSETEI